MDMLTEDQIGEADLTDWRKLGQGLHARYVVGDFGAGARFVGAVGEAGGIAAEQAVDADPASTLPPAQA